MNLIPTSTVYVVQRDERGVVVWAVQKALSDLGLTLSVDGVFGQETEQKVRAFQGSRNVLVDGVFGSVTSSLMAKALERRISTLTVPQGLVRGVVSTESGGLIGAINKSVPGGIDCGYLQRRVYEADYDDEAVVHRAFDGLYQMTLLARTLRSRHDAFFGRSGARTHEKAWRLAALHHNYPYAADKIASEGVSKLSSYWTSPASWVEGIGARFTDGQPVRTPLEWCQRYALGSSEHGDLGATTRFVDKWTT